MGKGMSHHSSLTIITRFHFNPLYPPPKVSLTQWAKEFAEVFGHAFEIYEGGTSIILDALENTMLKR
ncbi:MAG: hypothetical protein DRJ33_07885 [Candidatus Methanomethylicota archaeon]|uniref:Uncharacterized protein n=1 Tax=Thermoproteota archaeon TaxID=2056631 RepID=A0A497ES11_9CREN|nr:MAG: hypothetical protein DRJ33_07885 [Candidatus Verstraetearchaeota archaeon]